MVVDSGDRPVAGIETTSVRVVPLSEVDDAHAADEGENTPTVTAWRAVHEAFWHGEDMRRAMDDPGFTVDDATMVVLERFRLVERLG